MNLKSLTIVPIEKKPRQWAYLNDIQQFFNDLYCYYMTVNINKTKRIEYIKEYFNNLNIDKLSYKDVQELITKIDLAILKIN